MQGSKRPLILAVRHGKTAFNNPKHPRLRAWQDAALDPSGRLDAQIAASKLKPYNPKIIYHSDMARDTETANIMGRILGIPTEPDYNLRTADMGEWTGRLEEEVAPLVAKWYDSPWMDAPSGESYFDFVNRFFPCFDCKMILARDADAFRPIVTVFHGRNFAALHSRYDMIDPKKAKMPTVGGVAYVYEDERGDPQMEWLTETEPVLEDA